MRRLFYLFSLVCIVIAQVNNDVHSQETSAIPQFSHKSHIEDMGIECIKCHQALNSQSVHGCKIEPSPKEICSQCHNGSDASIEPIAGISDEKKNVKIQMPLFSHKKHLAHTENCIACHKDINSETNKIKTPPPMADCMKCHNNSKADASCKVCHENLKKLIPKSHTPRWVYRNGHGTMACYNQDKCTQCHSERECTQCHHGQTSFKIHRPGYKLSHGMDARQRSVNCSYCHDVENDCAQCHARKR